MFQKKATTLWKLQLKWGATQTNTAQNTQTFYYMLEKHKYLKDQLHELQSEQ